ncbi:MAG: hypothetical protein LBV12_02685 [Puniceicoccales bacterium]|jgi:hypothetical protein|nr:hypothetical protein [Puniceicoccales bacterium]
MKKFRFALPLVIAALMAIPFTAGAQDKEAKSPPSRGERRGAGAARQAPNAMPGLNKEDAEKVKAAMEKSKTDPAVVKAEAEAKSAQEAVAAARKAVRDAEGDDAKKAAQEKAQVAGQKSREAYQKVMEAKKAAAIKADPSVEAIFKKAEENRKKMQENRQGQGRDGQRGRDGARNRGGRGGNQTPPEKPAKPVED